ncbi:hypothetical protein G6F37_010653 [Rhizopus arrhizus]|nr:hypothetical protein G6F38_010434 [Rhizopus arrhizus]KAG1153106.1 hypothetical protein G6F37_010653 [Rhizopus arrhizus]
MAIVSNSRMLSSPIPITAISMEDKTNEIIITGSRSSLLAIKKFLTAGIIEVSPTQSESYLSNFFTIQESTKKRLILDCSQLNRFLQYQLFKMEGVPALRQIIEKDNLMCKLDLKDAYVVVPIHPASQQYLSLIEQA